MSLQQSIYKKWYTVRTNDQIFKCNIFLDVTNSIVSIGMYDNNSANLLLKACSG